MPCSLGRRCNGGVYGYHGMITRSDAPETIAMRERLLPEHGTMSELHFPLGYYEGTCLEVNPAAVRRSVWVDALQCAQRKTTSAFPQESADVVFCWKCRFPERDRRVTALSAKILRAHLRLYFSGSSAAASGSAFSAVPGWLRRGRTLPSRRLMCFSMSCDSSAAFAATSSAALGAAA